MKTQLSGHDEETGWKGVGVMDRQGRALVVLAEDPAEVPSIRMEAHIVHNSSSRGWDALF